LNIQINESNFAQLFINSSNISIISVRYLRLTLCI